MYKRQVLAYVVMGAIALAVVDLLFVMVAGGDFGRISGWVAAVPSVFVFTEQFRRYEGGSRWAVVIIGVVLGLGAGIASTLLLPPTWPSLATGGVGGLVAALAYSVLWYAGIKIYGEERP
ncbi:hypothetical protein [Glycomyces tenuis]|uniref:hypothetical protein n=1 Tax=Glycomyces tenuis TaxID=58116 RepID=UPI000B2C85DB|nr:hypothetical protein [Glycomyces tenuis]